MIANPTLSNVVGKIQKDIDHFLISNDRIDPLVVLVKNDGTIHRLDSDDRNLAQPWIRHHDPTVVVFVTQDDDGKVIMQAKSGSLEQEWNRSDDKWLKK